MEEERIYGTIFLPDSPDKRTLGVWLIIKNNSICIEAPANSLNDEKWNIILGEFNGIDKITFVNCHSGAGSSGAGGTHQNIHASYLIKDFHAFNSSDLFFKRIVLTSPALTKWIIEEAGIKALNRKTFQIPEVQKITKVTVKNVDVTINLDYSQSYSSQELHVMKVCSIIIESNSLIDIAILDKLMRHLKKLILFLTNKNPEFNRYVLFRNEPDGYELQNTNDDLREDMFTQGIQINYRDIKNSLDSVIKKWFEHEELYPTIDLVLERCFNTEMSPHGFFISICMAIEIFQNNFGKKTNEIIDSLVSQNREKIITIINDETLQIWFKDKSQYWSSPTFKDRLMEFQMIIGELMKGVFNITSEEFISKIVRTRNDIVHRGDYRNCFTSTELFLATKIIEFTLKLNIIKLMGIDTRKAPYSLCQNAKGNIDVLAHINNILVHKE